MCVTSCISVHETVESCADRDTVSEEERVDDGIDHSNGTCDHGSRLKLERSTEH